MKISLCVSALQAFISTIEDTGGVKDIDGRGTLVPVADEDWIDLGSAYQEACVALGLDVNIEETSRTDPIDVSATTPTQDDNNLAAVQVLGSLLMKVKDQLHGIQDFNPLELRTEIDQVLQSDIVTRVATRNKKDENRLFQLEDILHQLYVQTEASASVLSQIVKRPVIEPADVAPQAGH